MQIATWNVNSLKIRFTQVVEWLQYSRCDILGIQELKMDNASNQALVEAFQDCGYHYVYNGQKTYNGVALLTKVKPEQVECDIPGYLDPQKRVIAATISGIRVICAYVVNGESLESSKYQYKLEWLEYFKQYVAEQLSKYPNLVVLGDYNIAPEARDTYAPELWEGQVLCSVAERSAFNQLLQLGLADSFRVFNQEERQFSWWDYRNLAFRRKQGLRIDHLLISTPLLNNALACHIDLAPRKLERPSDHTPVVLTLKD